MSDWNPPKYTVDDVNDFVIPDEEVSTPDTNSPNYGSNANHGSSTNTNTSTNIFSQFGFVPKVDLSSAFSSFSTGQNMPEHNRVQERQFTGGDTLDEPILETLKRDLLQIAKRLYIVVWPMQLEALALKQQQNFIQFAQANGIRVPELINQRIPVPDTEDERTTGVSNIDLIKQETLDWDLWGPLIFSLVFSVCLSLSASNDQTNLIFSGSFAFVWVFYFVIGLNIQLLGGSISFMSAISAAGYSMFPIVVGEVICSLLLKWKLLRLILMFVLNCWSIYVGQMSLKCSGVLPGRVLLANFPLVLMFSTLSWLVVIT